ncbi:MAG: glycosyltransferase domain-containing protein [Gammaproteobacteria bacterium]
MQKIIVYTAITGGKDRLQEIDDNHPDCDFVCFSDDKSLTAHGWKVVYQPPLPGNSRLDAKRCKILVHEYFPDHEYSLWLDGNFTLAPQMNIKAFISVCLADADLATFKHPNVLASGSRYYRNCVYAEAEVCTQLKLDDPRKIIAQIDRYKNEGYPRADGLRASGVLIRAKRLDRQILVFKVI